MKKKVLVIYARYGSGHKSIAEYVANYLENYNNKCEIMLLDISLYGNWLARTGVKVMDWVGTHRTEFIFNFCYELMDHKLSTIGHNRIAKKSYDNETLRKIIKDFDPDITISSHFYGSDIILYYNKIGLTHSKILTIITDYRTHECWIKNKEYEDGYIVGNELVKEELIERGVKPNKIYPFGLPLNIEKIGRLSDEEDILKKYNLPKNKKIYLFFGGSSIGSMYYFDYFKVATKLALDAEVIFICGKNANLKSHCDEYIKKHGITNFHVFGYSNDVLNLMKISDLVISKPGGATLTEAMEMRVPLLLIPGVGGQEKYNARFIARKKYGYKVRGLYFFKKMLLKLDNNPQQLEKIKERLKKQDNNKSVEKISNLINKL